MIGGVETRIPTAPGAAPVEVAVRAICRHWPDAVFEDAITAVRYNQSQSISLGQAEELFVYRDREAADIWEASGAIPAVYNTMIHLVPDDDALTLVVDKHDREMDQIIADVATELAGSKRS